MGRRAVHTVDAFLDAAVDLFAAGGAEAVTMTAVARAVGAPSGSVYHRFADRPAMLAALWLRTARRFEQGYGDALGADPTPERAVAAAVWAVRFCRDHPAEAALLHAGPTSLQPDSWPDVDLDARDADRNRWFGAAVRTVAAANGRHRDEVAFAMYDLPLAVMRQYLGAGTEVPAAAVDRVRRLATRLLLDAPTA